MRPRRNAASTAAPSSERRRPVGAEVVPGGVHFRVWAPARRRVEVVLERSAAGPSGAARDDSRARRAAAGAELQAERDASEAERDAPEAERDVSEAERDASEVGPDASGPGRTGRGRRPRAFELEPEPGGYHAGLVHGAAPGDRYRYRLDGELLRPDPASRFQPEGPHGPSEVVDPSRFPWTDEAWAGPPSDDQVLLEVHVGTYTREGTWEAAARSLPQVRDTGFTCVALLPVADFHGRFGWGYDGVDLFAPTRLYGGPDDFRAFVDRAHGLGIGILLDVVYNHIGSVGNYLRDFSERWFSERYRSAWGEVFNLDQADSEPVREFLLSNVQYWIEEFHVDGFRVDAANEIHDTSTEHLLSELVRRARRAADGRRVLLVAENEAQQASLTRAAEEGGHGFDATWNEDFHHSVMVATTGRREAYYTDYRGSAQELVSLARRGFLYQGQRYLWQNKRRGTPVAGLRPTAFVNYLQNHDQVANTPRGERLHELVSPAELRAVTAYLLLSPGTPLLFQGQDFAASTPFLYFADAPPELGEATREGRREHMAQFPSLATPESRERFPADPTLRETFERCRLDHAEREQRPEIVALHRDLIRIRRRDPALRGAVGVPPEGAVLGDRALALRYAGADSDDRLLLLNLGPELRPGALAEPLLAPPAGREWAVSWSSEHPDYGGWGTPPLETEEGWRIPPRAAVLLAAASR